MSNNEHWNTVDWSQIPEDVEAVVTFNYCAPTYFKLVEAVTLLRNHGDIPWELTSKSLVCLEQEYGNRFHLRPTPSTQPTPEPPESTQVESSQVEATSVPEFDWSAVDKDIEAVFLNPSGALLYVFKTIRGVLHYAMPNWEEVYPSPFENLTNVKAQIKMGNLRGILIEKLQVNATSVEEAAVPTTPEFDWSTVGDDVEAVIFEGDSPCQLLKQGDNWLLHKWIGSNKWHESNWYKNVKEREERLYEFQGHGKVVKLIMRPPATPPLDKVDDQPITCKVEFYEGELPEGMVDLDKVGGEIQVEYVTLEKPSIQSILSNAQELIKKHHNVTGEVKFTIKCS